MHAQTREEALESPRTAPPPAVTLDHLLPALMWNPAPPPPGGTEAMGVRPCSCLHVGTGTGGSWVAAFATFAVSGLLHAWPMLLAGLSVWSFASSTPAPLPLARGKIAHFLNSAKGGATDPQKAKHKKVQIIQNNEFDFTHFKGLFWTMPKELFLIFRRISDSKNMQFLPKLQKRTNPPKKRLVPGKKKKPVQNVEFS